MNTSVACFFLERPKIPILIFIELHTMETQSKKAGSDQREEH